MADLKNDLVRLTGEINALNETIRRIVNEGGNGGLLRRYENPNTTGDTAWNGSRKKLRDEEDEYAAALQGKTIPPKTMGPPAGHPGHRRTFGGPVTHHGTPLCAVCGMVHSATPLSKTMLDFDGDLRRMSHTRHAGHVTVCGCGRTIRPQFPGLPGTFFGDEALRHILLVCSILPAAARIRTLRTIFAISTGLPSPPPPY